MKNETLRIFSTNLEYLMKKNGIKATELAKRMGVAKQTVSTWVNGQNVPRTDKLDKLCGILGCDRNALLMRTPVTDLYTIPVPRQSMLPVLGRVSAGTGVAAEEDIIGYESTDSRYDNGEYFYLRVSGDSMSPKIDDGDLVLVHRQTSVDSGSIGVVSVDGSDGFVKKIEYDKEFIHLISYNPYYPPMVFDGPDVMRVYVMGRVVKLERKL